MALKDIKNKIKSTERTHKVTRAMEAVSAVKMRKTQQAALADRSYAEAALSILTRLSGTEDVKQHPLAAKRGSNKLALLVITSDKGLAGALNSGVIKRALEAVEGRSPAEVTVFAYGRKGEEYFARRGYRMVGAFGNKQDDVPLGEMEELMQIITAGFLAGEFDKVVTVYSKFKSTFEQVPTMRRLLPLSLPALTEIVEGIIPNKGRFSDARHLTPPAAYTVEPQSAEVLGGIIPRLITVALYHMLLESKASEHSARMVAMKSASDKSEEVAFDLTRLYNKIRQAAITREVSEIVGGREALAK